MKSTVGDGKRRSGLFLGRLWWVGELSTADTCQGFWGYNREAFRKKGCLLTNTGGYVWCTVRVCLCVCLCPSACLCKCIYDTPETLQPVKDTFPCFFHSYATAYNAVENPGNGALQHPSSRLGWTVCCRCTRPQSATSLSPLWTAVEPHVMAACHTFSIAWADTLWFLALVTYWGSSTPPWELFISHSPIWTICIFFHLQQMGQKTQMVGVSV